MPRQISPYHSKTGEVYHVYAECTAGKSMKRGRRVKGKGNKKFFRESAIKSLPYFRTCTYYALWAS